jgi:type III secretion apparatus needle protein
MNILSSVANALTDPGALVKDAINTVLPKSLSVVGDIAGAAVDFETGRPLQGLQHGMQALKDLPQALQTVAGAAGGASTAARTGSAAFQPSPPPALGGHSALLNSLLGSDKLQQSLQSLITALVNALQGHATPPASGTAAGAPSTPAAAGTGSCAPTASGSGAATSTPAPSTGATSGTAPAASSGGAAPKNLSDLLGLSDANFMKAMTSGALPADVKNDPQAMLQIQARMNQISQMTELLSTMMKAMHDMQMAVIQNVRV